MSSFKSPAYNVKAVPVGKYAKAALEKLGELMFDPDDKGQDKLNEIYHKVISMPERVKSVKALSDALKNFFGIERPAYDIDGPEGDNSVKQLSDLMDSLSQGA